MRLDFILKKKLFDHWMNAKDSVAFPFREHCKHQLMWAECHNFSMPVSNELMVEHKCWWYVPDRLVAMPRYALEAVRNRYGELKISHEIFKTLMSVNDSWISKHIVFWLNEHHESNTQWDRNPIYNIAGRRNIHHDEKEVCWKSVKGSNGKNDQEYRVRGLFRVSK